MTETAGKTAGGRRPRFGGDVRISDDEWVRDDKTGELRLSEKGVTRQKEDILALADRLGVDIVKWYEENDTTAFKKKRIRLPNGRSVWRVIRPEFREMLEDYEDGKIDGVIFYDLDRLARQPRDLEDLIDLAEYYKRPVATVTGELDLRTANGRTMARVLVAMASKSSEDTSRRVARARLQEAQQGGNSGRVSGRRFGYTAERGIAEAEARLIRDGAKRLLAGESWNSVARFYHESGIPPVGGGRWSYGTIRQIYLSPTIAGIAMYNGAMRKENQEGRKQSPYADPGAVALKDTAGEYIRSTVWEPILSVAEWEALVADWKRRRAGTAFSASGTRKYLLSGLLRCGRIRADGTVCNRSLTGTVVVNSRNGKIRTVYRCPSLTLGGCSAMIATAKLDPLIEELLFAHIVANSPQGDDELSAVPDPGDPDAAELADVQGRLFKLRTGYAQGTVTDDSMFNIVPQLEARERKLRSELAKKAKIRRGRMSRAQSADDVRREWDTGDVGVRRAVLSRYLKAIVIRKSTLANTRLVDYSAIEPVWRDDDDPMPGEYLA
jgi:DNA invertase Pin-like site-specific DNA recombinase